MTAIPGLNTLRNILSEKVATVIPRDVFHPIATTILVDRILGAEAKDPLTEYLTKHKCILHAMLKEIRGENDKPIHSHSCTPLLALLLVALLLVALRMPLLPLALPHPSAHAGAVPRPLKPTAMSKEKGGEGNTVDGTNANARHRLRGERADVPQELVVHEPTERFLTGGTV